MHPASQLLPREIDNLLLPEAGTKRGCCRVRAYAPSRCETNQLPRAISPTCEVARGIFFCASHSCHCSPYVLRAVSKNDFGKGTYGKQCETAFPSSASGLCGRATALRTYSERFRKTIAAKASTESSAKPRFRVVLWVRVARFVLRLRLLD
jgi:hypothetical protein